MKKSNIALTYDAEKLSALKLYLEQKDLTLDSELTAAVDHLYVKIVPSHVRDYIELRAGAPETAEKKRPQKPKVSITDLSTQGRGENA